MSVPWYSWHDTALILNVRVQPRASRDQIAGVLGERLKIRLSAPPVDGKANQALLRFLAQLCAVPVAQVTLLGAQTGRNKRVRIENPRRLPRGVDRPKA
jgi:uncharacterized protein (TIGR00251 family)